MDKYQRACQIWAVLAYAASKGETLTYKKLGNATGLPHYGLSPYLGLLQEYCKEHEPKLPPLTALVLTEAGEPESGCDVTPEELPAALKQIFQHKWMREEAPTPDALKKLG